MPIVLPSGSGIWTPAIAGQSVAGAQTYSVRKGFWRIVGGDLCYVSFRVTLTAHDGATAGNLLLTGLPFLSADMSFAQQAIALSEWSNITLSVGYTDVSFRITNQANTVLFVQNGSGVTSDVISAATGLANNTEIAGSGFYIASF